MAAPDNLRNIRTLEDVSYLLNILFTNLNNLDALYYDMFINPVAMDLELERYNENGELVKVPLANRAKERIRAYTGAGNPNGKQAAEISALYIDTSTNYIYYKSSGVGTDGWVLIWSANNLKEGEDYLKPTGSGAKLTDLNALNINAGTLSVKYGGTGVNAISGMVKGNGINAFSQAVDGTDYLGPNSMTGLIAYYPVILNGSNETLIPEGWLRLDGGNYSSTTYNKLFQIIGYTYGRIGDDFRVPNALGLFIRSWDTGREATTVENGQVGTHSHSLSGCTTLGGSPHKHTPGDLDHTHTYTALSRWGKDGMSSSPANWSRGDSGKGYATGTMSSAQNWSGSTAEESSHTHNLTGFTANNADEQETLVKNIAFVPIIKY